MVLSRRSSQTTSRFERETKTTSFLTPFFLDRVHLLSGRDLEGEDIALFLPHQCDATHGADMHASGERLLVADTKYLPITGRTRIPYLTGYSVGPKHERIVSHRLSW